MEDFGLYDGLIEAVQQRAAGRPVARVCVQVGVLHHVNLEAFRHAFAHAAEGTEAANAVLDIVVLPVRAVCRTCQAETAGDDVIQACQQCHGRDLDLIGGDELALESVEYEGPVATSWLGKE